MEPVDSALRQHEKAYLQQMRIIAHDLKNARHEFQYAENEYNQITAGISTYESRAHALNFIIAEEELRHAEAAHQRLMQRCRTLTQELLDHWESLAALTAMKLRRDEGASNETFQAKMRHIATSAPNLREIMETLFFLKTMPLQILSVQQRRLAVPWIIIGAQRIALAASRH